MTHFVRPDRVYATGVLTPIVGYQPAEAANQVGAMFVSGGQGLGMFRPFSRTRAFVRSIALRGPTATFWSWIREQIASVQVRLQIFQLNNQTRMQRFLPASLRPAAVVDTSPRAVGPTSSADQSPMLMTPQGAADMIQGQSAASEEKTSAPPLGMALRRNAATVNDANAYWRGVINSGSGYRPRGAGY